MTALLTIGLVLLISNLIAFASADVSIIDNWLTAVLIPAIFFGLGLFAKLQPLVAAIACIVVIVAIAVLNYIALGPLTLISGWIYKVICLYFIFIAVRHAKDAEQARKELQSLS